MKKLTFLALLLVAYLSSFSQFGGNGPTNQATLYINQQVPLCGAVDSCLGLNGVTGDSTLVLSQAGIYVPVGSGGYWTQNDSVLYNTDTTKNVGIGTAYPLSKFHVLSGDLNIRVGDLSDLGVQRGIYIGTITRPYLGFDSVAQALYFSAKIFEYNNTGGFYDNIGTHYNDIYLYSGAEVHDNELIGTDASISQVYLHNSNSAIIGNIVSGYTYRGNPLIGFSDLWDQDTVAYNTIDSSSIWDLRMGEYCSVQHNAMHGTCVIDNIWSTAQDRLDSNTMLSESTMQAIHQDGYSRISSNFLDVNARMANITQLGSNIRNSNLSVNGYMANIVQVNADLNNNTDSINGLFQFGINDTSHSRGRYVHNEAWFGGNVGIGTTNPTASLHVDGTVRYVDGNQGAGKHLVSDAFGNASWQPDTSGTTLDLQKVTTNGYVTNNPMEVDNSRGINVFDSSATYGVTINPLGIVMTNQLTTTVSLGMDSMTIVTPNVNLQIPDTNYNSAIYIPYTVNWQHADRFGNITVPTGTSLTLQQVTDNGYITTNDIEVTGGNLVVDIDGGSSLRYINAGHYTSVAAQSSVHNNGITYADTSYTPVAFVNGIPANTATGNVNIPGLVSSHAIFTPLTGDTVTVSSNTYSVINPAGTLANLTISLPTSPANNDRVELKFEQAVTTLTYINGTVVGGTIAAIPSVQTLVYDSNTATWY